MGLGRKAEVVLKAVVVQLKKRVLNLKNPSLRVAQEILKEVLVHPLLLFAHPPVVEDPDLPVQGHNKPMKEKESLRLLEQKNYTVQVIKK